MAQPPTELIMGLLLISDDNYACNDRNNVLNGSYRLSGSLRRAKSNVNCLSLLLREHVMLLNSLQSPCCVICQPPVPRKPYFDLLFNFSSTTTLETTELLTSRIVPGSTLPRPGACMHQQFLYIQISSTASLRLHLFRIHVTNFKRVTHYY